MNENATTQTTTTLTKEQELLKACRSSEDLTEFIARIPDDEEYKAWKAAHPDRDSKWQNMTKEQKAEFIATIKAEPRRFIAQEVIDFIDLDILDDDGVTPVPRKADLRAYVLTGETVRVWKRGLTRFSRNPDSFIVNSSQGGGFKDTWVLLR